MVDEMEKIRGLKLCITGRDMLPSTYKFPTEAKLIKERYTL